MVAPPYYSKEIRSIRVETRLAAVECDKCGSAYFYELARIGDGVSAAPYGIGVSLATRSAEKKSRRDLERRLAREAELVPCPKCQWINEDLVRGYRLGRYRRVERLAAWTAGLGTAISLPFGCLFLSDSKTVGYFVLIGGPAFFVALAGAMFLLRRWLRSRIRPNRDFPLPPRLPLGSPPALVANPISGELQVAQPSDGQFGNYGGWHEFQVGRHRFPPICCVCLKDAAPEHAYQGFVTPGVHVEVPRCAACARRAKRDSQRIWALTASILILIGGGALLALPIDADNFWIYFAGWAMVACGFASYVASKATAPAKIGRTDRSRGVALLRFKNPEYRPSLMERTTSSN